MLKTCLIVAILAGVGAVVLNFVQVKANVEAVMKARDDFHAKADEETNQHRKFEKLAKDTQSKLDATSKELADTKTELDSAKAAAEEAAKKEAAEAETLKKTEAERNKAQNELAAWNALQIPLDQIRATLASIKDLTAKNEAIEDEKKILTKRVARLENRLALLLNEDYVVPLPEGLKGKVLVADPRYDFVVLDIGENQGSKEGGKLLVNRNGRLIAKVVIKSVEPTRSIANIVPGWKISDIMEGDQVLY